jgi:hypothetical protein
VAARNLPQPALPAGKYREKYQMATETEKSRRRQKRMRKNLKVSQLWYTPEQYALVKAAAARISRPMTTLAILATLEEARRICQAEGLLNKDGTLKKRK